MKVVDLKGFRQANGIQQAELADFLSVSTSFISQIEKGKREIPENQLRKIMLNNIGWDTSMIWREEPVAEGASTPTINIPDRRIKLLPLLPFSAMAGYLSGGNDVDAFRSEEAVAVPDFSERGADCTIRVDGDSMYPRYSNGEILAIRIIKDVTFFQWGKVYVLSTNQGCVVKILLPDQQDPERIICRSVNRELYPDYTISKSDVFGVAIVVGHAGVE